MYESSEQSSFTKPLRHVGKIVKSLLPRGRNQEQEKSRKSSLALNGIHGRESPTPLEAFSEMPQAGMFEKNLEAFQERDWRKHFSDRLHGKGIEIGPLHRPMLRHDGMDIDYIDRFSVEELRSHYPELNDLPLVEANIIGDAQTLDNIDDEKYDFIIAAHVIEHMRNPILAIESWRRVIKPGGYLYMIVPDKRVIFDKKRVRTTLEHVIVDYVDPSPERDYEHFLEYALHVHDKHGVEALEEADRLLNTNYSIHIHVFIPSDVLNLLHWFSDHVGKIEIVEGPVMAPGSDEFHFLIAKK